MGKYIWSKKVYAFHPFIIILLAFLIYSGAIFNDFSLDDPVLIVHNKAVQGFSIDNLKSVFLSVPNNFEYLPFRDITYMIDYELWGLNPAGFHLSNIVYYVLACIILYFFLCSLLKEFTPHCEIISFITVLFFVSHPVHVENVAAISHRKDILSFLFTMLSLYFFLLHNERKKLTFYILSMATALFAIMSKGTAVVLPLLALLPIISTSKIHGARKFQNILKLLPHVLIISFFSIVQLKILSSTGGIKTSYPLDYYLHRTYTAPVALIYYIKLLIFPYPLTILHPMKAYKTLLSIPVLLSSLSFGLLVFLTWRFRKTPLLFFSLGWFLVSSLPVIGLIPTPSIVAERYVIVPSVGFCLLAGSFFHFLFHKSGLVRKTSTGALIILLVIFSIISIDRTFDWKSSLSLYVAGTKTDPDSARLHWKVGSIYFAKGEYDNSLKYFLRAGEIHKTYMIDYRVMEARVALANRKPGSALVSLDSITHPNKDYIVEVNYIYAKAYEELGKYENALARYKQALKSPISLDLFNVPVEDIKKRVQ